MAWQRKTPFGYVIQGGLIQSHPQEADAVRYIFGQYLAGASLLAIAEDMMRQGIRYHQHTAKWNKSMVKRILENRKYTGTAGYPQLVDEDNFDAAQQHRTERNTYVPLNIQVRPNRNMVTCAQCGSRMIRGTRSQIRVSWRCQGADCGQVVTISDEVLTELVHLRLRTLAQVPHLLTAPEPKQVESNMDTIRLQNELTLAFNRGTEKPDYIKTLALELAARRYSQIEDPTPAYELERLRERLEQGPADAGLLADLLTTAVRSVRLTSDKNVELELINGELITEEKEVQST